MGLEGRVKMVGQIENDRTRNKAMRSMGRPHIDLEAIFQLLCADESVDLRRALFWQAEDKVLFLFFAHLVSGISATVSVPLHFTRAP